MTDLVQRLRTHLGPGLGSEAADRIEALERENAELRKDSAKQVHEMVVMVRNAALNEAAKAVDKLANDKKATQQQQFALDIASDKIRELKP